MKITMKNTIAFATAVVLTLAFGSAYAVDDQMPDMNANRDTGTELYEAFLKHEASIGTGSAAGGVREEAVIRPHDATDEVRFMNTKDTGTELYEAYLKHEADIAKGSSAGGVRAKEVDRSDEYTGDTIPTWNQRR
ncbi:MAG: hypothetical protein ACYC7L_01425 [Nitrospirota bacterium]